MVPEPAGREALIGVVLAGGFGIGWTFWAASGLSGVAAAAIQLTGLVVGTLIVAGAVFGYVRAGRGAAGADDASMSMFGSRGYRFWVAAEVVALFGGNAVLAAVGRSAYVAAWVAFVVGVHFLGFGRLFAPVFYWLGAALVAAAVAGAVAGIVADTRTAVEVVSGLIAAASMFAAGGWRLLLVPG